MASTKSRLSRSLITLRIRGWSVWTVPRPVLLYVLTVEVLTCGIVIADALSGIAIDAQRWLHFTVLIAAAHPPTAHPRPRERRRASHGSEGLHSDLTSIFTFPAAVLLRASITGLVVGDPLPVDAYWADLRREPLTIPPELVEVFPLERVGVSNEGDTPVERDGIGVLATPIAAPRARPPSAGAVALSGMEA